MTEPIYYAQQVTCPNCAHSFENNKVNGLALITVVGNIEARMRMYSKLTLNDFERITEKKGAIPFADGKKIVLDNFNDFLRDIQTFLGYGNDVE